MKPTEFQELLNVLTGFSNIGFTGSQNGIAPCHVENLEKTIEHVTEHAIWDLTGHHGDCVGADTQFHDMCLKYGIPVYVYPPIVEKKRAFVEFAEHIYPEKKYLERNQDIVKAADFMLACPSSSIEKLRSGTWATVRYAFRQDVPTLLFLPDGEIQFVTEIQY